MKKYIKILIIFIITCGIVLGVIILNPFSKNKSNKKEEKPNLKDDFYTAINYDLFESREIPKDEVGWSIIKDIDKEISDEKKDMVKELLKDKNNNSNMYTLYNNILNKDARNKLGYEPIKKYMDLIDSAKNINELLSVIYNLDSSIGTEMLLNIELSKDIKDKTKKALSISSKETDCALLSDNNYLKTVEQSKSFEIGLLEKYGYNKDDSTKIVNDYYNLLKSSCNGALSYNDIQDIDKTYHVYNLEQVKSIFSNINIDEYLKDYRLNEIDLFIIPSEVTAREYNKLFVDNNLEILKNGAKIQLIEKYVNCLTTDMQDYAIKFSNDINGIEEAKSDEENALDGISAIFSDILEKQYVEKHKDEMKDKISIVTTVVNDIKNEYYNNINNATWLSDETKKNALKKLDNMKLNIGYPEDFKITSNLYNIKSYEEGSNLVENAINMYQVNHQYSIKDFFDSFGKDKKTWDFDVTEVNACYMSTDNSINIPIGIMFILNENADYYEVMGTIGTVVGHEITHAFDFNGSKFDEYGNYKNWWTSDDIKTFNNKKQEVVEYYKNFKYKNVELNTELNSGENMADLGSLETIINILKQKNPSNDEYKKFFESYAKNWASEYNDEYLSNMILYDEHPIDIIRVNAVLSNIEKFYEIYDIQKGDGMYIEPSKRIHIWTK